MGRIARKIPFQPLLQVGSRHREIMRRLISGQSQVTISRELNITQSRLSIICNSPLFKRELANLEGKVENKFVEQRGNVETRVSNLQHKALDILEDIVSKDVIGDSKVPLRLKKDAACDILDLGDLKKKDHNDGLNDFAKFVTDAFKIAVDKRNVERNITPDSVVLNIEAQEATG